jgi:peroxiredoxin Q/BCP
MVEELKVGSLAPDVSLTNAQGKVVRLNDLRGKNVVLYFYPKDDTPGCTKEACNFRDDYSEYKKMGAEVVGVSLDNETSHKKFADKYGLPFVLLSDNNKVVSKAFGVLGLGGLSAKRVTFIIDKEGKIRYIFPKVDVTHHSKEVINALQVLK